MFFRSSGDRPFPCEDNVGDQRVWDDSKNPLVPNRRACCWWLDKNTSAKRSNTNFSILSGWLRLDGRADSLDDISKL